MSQGPREREQLIYEAARLLAMAQAGDSSARKALAEWMAQNPRHVAEVLEQATLSARLQRVTPGQWTRALAAAKARSSNVVSLHSFNHVERARFAGFRRVALLAACLLLALGTFVAIRGVRTTTYETAPGETRVIALSDGSSAHLNQNSRLIARFRGSARELELAKGEAEFDVKHDPARPFRVEAHGVIAQALGTRFDVALGSNEVSVLVEQGSVAVSARGTEGDQSAELHQYESARVLFTDRGPPRMQLQKMADQELRRVLAWSGLTPRNGTTLEEIAARLNQSGNTRIVFDDTTAPQMQLGGAFEIRDPVNLVEALSHLGTVTVTGPDAHGAIHISSRRAPPDDARVGPP